MVTSPSSMRSKRRAQARDHLPINPADVLECVSPPHERHLTVCTLCSGMAEETKVIYHIDDEETPYLVKLNKAPDEVVLRDLKEALNRPNYKFFFKSMDEDFGWDSKETIIGLELGSNGRCSVRKRTKKPVERLPRGEEVPGRVSWLWCGGAHLWA